MDFQTIHILIYDTQISSIYKTIDHLKRVFTNVTLTKVEDEYLHLIAENKYDVILINLDVSPMDGIAILRESHSIIHHENYPYFIIYSEKEDDFLVELAYNSGADIYTSEIRNYNIIELMIKALARRIHSNPHVNGSKSGIVIDEEEFVVSQNGNKYELPKKEFIILTTLSKQPTKFFTKKELAIKIWHDEKIAEKRTIDVHIYNIRKLLGKKIIQSQKGKGYRVNKKYFA